MHHTGGLTTMEFIGNGIKLVLIILVIGIFMFCTATVIFGGFELMVYHANYADESSKQYVLDKHQEYSDELDNLIFMIKNTKQLDEGAMKIIKEAQQMANNGYIKDAIDIVLPIANDIPELQENENYSKVVKKLTQQDISFIQERAVAYDNIEDLEHIVPWCIVIEVVLLIIVWIICENY